MRPRPIVICTLAYGAGLATGLAHFGDTGGALLLLLVGATLLRRRVIGVYLAAAMLGRGAGWLSWQLEVGRCSSRLVAGEVRFQAILEEPADSAEGLVALRPLEAGCAGSIDARWVRGQPESAGALVEVAGRWSVRPGAFGRGTGVLTAGSVHRLRPGSGALNHVRDWLALSTRRLYGDRAALVDALILNRRGDLDPDLRDRYAWSGLVHILSISGFHVGLIAGWMFLLGRLLRRSRNLSLILASVASVGYVAFIGWPPPAARAAALSCLATTCRIRQRRVEPDAMLALTGLVVMLLDPWALTQLGAWLSVAALWGATRFSRWSDQRLSRSFGWRTLFSSLGATLTTAPLTAATLGTVSLVGIALNFVAIPLAGVAVPGILVSLVLHPVLPPLAEALASGAGAALSALDLLADLGSRVPGGHLVLVPGLGSAVPWALLLGVTLWGMGRLNTVNLTLLRWGLASAMGAWGTLLLGRTTTAGDNPSDLALDFLDVGQGDGAVIRTPGGHWVVIDAGPRTDREDAGRRVVLPFLDRHGVRRLSALVVSHAHADHLGGVGAVLDRLDADLVIEPGELISDPLYLGFLDEVSAHHLRWEAGRPGQQFVLDSVRFTVLHPDTAWAEWGRDLNEDSIVLLVEYHRFRALFAGDAGFEAETRLRGRVGRVDLLKVGHHGSCTASGDGWLAELAPSVAVVSVGRVNRYGHPCPATLHRLAGHGLSVWRTDREGEISVRTDGQTVTIQGRRGTERYQVRNDE